MPLGKYESICSSNQGKIVDKTRFFNLGKATKGRKTLNSNQLYSALKLSLCHILLVMESKICALQCQGTVLIFIVLTSAFNVIRKHNIGEITFRVAISRVYLTGYCQQCWLYEEILFIAEKLLNRPICIMVRMFANGSGNQDSVESYKKNQKWYLIPPCLIFRIIRYGSRVSEAIQGKK